jgi:hypothetical protein
MGVVNLEKRLRCSDDREFFPANNPSNQVALLKLCIPILQNFGHSRSGKYGFGENLFALRAKYLIV